MRVVVALTLAGVLLASHSSGADAYYRHGYRGGYYGPRVGVYVGTPWYWRAPYWSASWAWGGPWGGYGYPYGWGYGGWGYAAPADFTGAPVYTERNVAAPASASGGAWYYCDEPPGYYPHVSLCNRPWVEVAPFAVQRDTRQPPVPR